PRAGAHLGVLVREPRALVFHDRGRGVVLAGDELDLVVLAAAFVEHRLPEDRVDLRDRLEREAGGWRDRHCSPTPSLPLPATPFAAERPGAYLPTNEEVPDDPRVA